MRLGRPILAILASLVLIGSLCPAVQADDEEAEVELRVYIIAPPSVTTIAAQQVGSTWAILRGRLTSLGTASSVLVYFEWGPITEDYSSNTTLKTMTSPGTFRATIWDFDPVTTYHFRAVAVGDDTTYGLDKSFTTRKPARGWWGRMLDEIFARLMSLF